MSPVLLDSVRKTFAHRPVLFNWLGRERAGETRALDGLSLSAEAGEVVALLGPNGSGKTTLLKLLATILLPDQGRVLVEGTDTAADARQARRHVGFGVATERSFFPRLTARENLGFFASLEDVTREERPARIDEALRQAALTDAADTLAMKFSAGMYQRLGVARALLKRPSILLLDEPTRSLDPASTRRLRTLVTKLAECGTCILLATHSFEEAAEVAGRAVILQAGRMVADRPLAGSADELRAFYFSQVEPETEPLMQVHPS